MVLTFYQVHDGNYLFFNIYSIVISYRVCNNIAGPCLVGHGAEMGKIFPGNGKSRSTAWCVLSPSSIKLLCLKAWFVLLITVVEEKFRIKTSDVQVIYIQGEPELLLQKNMVDIGC